MNFSQQFYQRYRQCQQNHPLLHQKSVLNQLVQLTENIRVFIASIISLVTGVLLSVWTCIFINQSGTASNEGDEVGGVV